MVMEHLYEQKMNFFLIKDYDNKWKQPKRNVGGFHLIAHLGGGGGGVLPNYMPGKSLIHYQTPRYSNGNNYITPLLYPALFLNPSPSLIHMTVTQLTYESRTARPVHPMHSQCCNRMLIFNSLEVNMLEVINSAWYQQLSLSLFSVHTMTNAQYCILYMSLLKPANT